MSEKNCPASLTAGLWLSLPVLAIVAAAWFVGISRSGMYLLIVAGALSLPWSLLGGFAVWLALSALAEATSIDAVSELYWGISCTAIAGAHLNGYLLFGRRKPTPAPLTPTHSP